MTCYIIFVSFVAAQSTTMNIDVTDGGSELVSVVSSTTAPQPLVKV